MATNISLPARTQTTNIKLSFTNDRCDLICALQQAELKPGTVFSFSLFYMEPRGEALRSRQSGLNWLASRGQDIDLGSSLCLVEQCCHSAAHTNPQMPYKKPRSMRVSDRAVERKKTAKIGCVPKFYASEVDKKCARTCLHVLYSLFASLSVWTPVTTTFAGSLRAEVCDSAAVMDRARLKAIWNAQYSV